MNEQNKIFYYPTGEKRLKKTALPNCCYYFTKYLKKQEPPFGGENMKKLSSVHISNFVKRLTTIIWQISLNIFPTMQIITQLYPHSQNPNNVKLLNYVLFFPENFNFTETEISAYDFLVPTEIFFPTFSVSATPWELPYIFYIYLHFI